MKTVILIFIAVLTGGLAARGQDLPPVVRAFEESYGAEAEGRYGEAIARLEPFAEAADYEVSLRLGWLFYLEGNYPVSAEHYERAMRRLPYAIEPKLGYVLPLAALGHWDEVVDVYQQILEIDPHNTLVHYRLGAIYYERQQYEEAYRHTEKVFNLYPFDYDTVVLFAWINLQMQRPEKANALFLKALMIQPASESARQGLQALARGR